jgi:hypothetical protein
MNEHQEPAAADFLDRLVGKARGEDSGLRPRLPSFFEPIRHVRMGMAAEAEPTGQIDEGADSILRTARDDSLTRVQPAAPTAEAQPHEAETPHTRRPHEPVQSPGTRAETSQVVPATPAPAPLVVARPRGPIEPLAALQDGLAPTTPRLSVAAAVLAEAIRDSAPTRNGAHATHTQGEARSNESAWEHLPAREPVRVGRRAVANEEEGEATLAARLPAKNGALVPSPEPSVRRVVVEARTTRRRSAPEQARVEAPAAEATPVINVTIGRVEVRAVPTAPLAQRTEARGPRPMSLEEYLKRRGGGR